MSFPFSVKLKIKRRKHFVKFHEKKNTTKLLLGASYEEEVSKRDKCNFILIYNSLIFLMLGT